MASLSFISASKLSDLLALADKHKNMYVRVLNANRLALGSDPLKPSLIIDLSKEKVDAYSIPAPGATTPPPDNEKDKKHIKSQRRTGNYWFEIKGNRVNCFSSKERLAEALRALEHVAPGTLEKLSSVKPRYRRIVARDPNFLFEKPHLVEQYVEQLIPGWWHGTNNNDQQKQVWLKRACSLAGLTWGVDFRMGPDSSLPPAMDL